MKKKTKIKKCLPLNLHKSRMVDLFFNRLIRVLRSNEFDIVLSKKISPWAGFVNYDKGKIYLNPKEFPIEETLIHEILHILKPKVDERTISELSSLIYEQLTPNQRDLLLAYIDALRK